MKYVPSTIVLAVLLLVFASWPSMEAWSELNAANHFLDHALFLLSGSLCGLQTARWATSARIAPALKESGVSS